MPGQFQSQKAYEMMSSSSMIRIIIVWLICLASLRLDYLNDFDLRFQIRGDRPAPNDIILIELNPSDLRHFNTSEIQDLLLLNSASEISDHYYWNPMLWNSLLSNLLQLQPKKIIVTLDLVQQALTESFNQSLLTNSKINWLFVGAIDAVGLPIIPIYEKRRFLDVLNVEFEKDGLVRKINSKSDPNTAHYINFQGSQNRFFKISYNSLINNQWPVNFFKDKIIVIGGFTNSDYEYISPTGPFSRNSLVAQIVENKTHSQWIHSLNFWPQSFVLLVLLALIYFCTLLFPRNLSISITLVCLFITLILNIYLFDIHHFWFPLVSTSLCLFLGWLTGYTVVASDIEKKNFQLENENETRRQLELLKTNFISLISHDLKNPLAKIQSVVQRNLANQSDPIVQSDLTAIQKYSEELDGYIRSMLNIARVESQDIKLNIVPSDLNQIIEASIELLKPLAADKSIEIKSDLSPLFLIQLDPILIKEALINIIENAIKYSPALSFIQIRSYEATAFVIVEIKDNGFGIPDEELKNIGQKFFRSQSVPESIKGTGLGLFLVKYFVELHSGTMEVTSSLNKGTSVTLRLPNR